MEKKLLGNTKLETAPIIFGGNVFGWTANEKESFELMDQFLDMGFNMIDSADVYSRWAKGNSGGESESIIGKYMKARGNRHKLTIATKVGSSMQQGGDKNISKTHILKAVEDSLRRLQTDHIDLYFTHWDDDKTPVEETLEAYQKLIDQGKVRYIGASNLSPERLKASLEASKTEGLPKYEVFQPEYSLMVRDKFEGDIQEICKKNNLGVTSYFSLASGFLTGKYDNLEGIKGTEREQFLKEYFNDRGKKVLKALKDISDHHNISQAGIALRWIIQRPGVTAPIASTTKPDHFKSFKEAISFELTSEEMTMLNNASS
ncbi:aldo/keto reductase [Christiangramia forsetii]|uniref:Aldo/keto reductase family protein n=2 Tax=Christiangramia forsetii TaxID=411153 RepID=A0M0E3_CHRFK|nr:aldo/keto reductase [Christiangramia forsetii]GGG41101.1 NADP-dependent aryl-alcohol dehydrogenase [Christiangramia forsetii]CAL66088.1 aldo/keto reductase family protein [Christiangramia forsetii KT0803]